MSLHSEVSSESLHGPQLRQWNRLSIGRGGRRHRFAIPFVERSSSEDTLERLEGFDHEMKPPTSGSISRNSEDATFDKDWLPAAADFGTLILALREHLGYTQEEFGALLDLTSRRVSGWETGGLPGHKWRDYRRLLLSAMTTNKKHPDRHWTSKQAEKILTMLDRSLTPKQARRRKTSGAPSFKPSARPETADRLTVDRLQSIVNRFDQDAKPPNWSLQEHIAWSRFGISYDDLMHKWDSNHYYQKLARYCLENSSDSEALKAFEAYQLHASPLVDPQEAVALAKAGLFPEFSEFLETRSQAGFGDFP